MNKNIKIEMEFNEFKYSYKKRPETMFGSLKDY